MDKYKLVPFSSKYKEQFIKFSDKFIGQNYFNELNFEKQIKLSTQDNLNSSFVLTDKENKVVGIRLTYAPGSWLNEIKIKYIQNSNVQLNKVAYFKSLFIAPAHQKKGLGPNLSAKSIEVLKSMGASHILSHSWKESPNNSSVKYLNKSGFKPIGEIPNFWVDVDYLCTGCNIKPCTCTAVEMLYKI